MWVWGESWTVRWVLVGVWVLDSELGLAESVGVGQ